MPEAEAGNLTVIDGEEWEMIGRVAVDSGQMMLSDPCYVKDFKHRDEVTVEGDTYKGEYSYDGACHATLHNNGAGMLGEFMGAVSSTGWGDGMYPVLVQRDKRAGRIRAMMVDFDNVSKIEGEEDDEW